MKGARILVVDDEPAIRKTLARSLDLEGYEVHSASNLAEADALLRSQPPDLALLDVRLPDGNGLDLLERLGGDGALPLPFIVISGNASIEDAVRALQLGAETYLEKPPESERLLRSIELALERVRLGTENEELKGQAALEGGSRELLGRTPVMQQLDAHIQRVALSEGRVLILGENGTGKELVARAIHARSDRASRPFVSLNCAAVPDELIESELFGHEKGAFTGATGMKKGKFERAHRGTLFLDEVGDMPANMQAKLLRVLELGELERVGGERSLSVDVRVLAATNKNLQDEIDAGRFREDLYYRLAVVELKTPPLRERRDDIPLLAERFLMEAVRRNRRQGAPLLTDRAKAVLSGYDYPGNVRELRNLVERIVILVPPDQTVVDGTDVQALMPTRRKTASLGYRPGEGLSDQLREVERSILTEALAAHDGVIARAAETLRIDRSNLSKKLRELGIK